MNEIETSAVAHDCVKPLDALRVCANWSMVYWHGLRALVQFSVGSESSIAAADHRAGYYYSQLCRWFISMVRRVCPKGD